MKSVLFVLCFLLSHQSFALTRPETNTPEFNFSTSVPFAPKPIRYDVIETITGELTLSENTSIEFSQTEETEDTFLAQETLSFSPKQQILSKQNKKITQSFVTKMRKNKQSKVSITLFFYQGSGFQTAESKRLALKRSLSLKNEFKNAQIKTSRIFIQIKETATAQTSHIAHIFLED